MGQVVRVEFGSWMTIDFGGCHEICENFISSLKGPDVKIKLCMLRSQSLAPVYEYVLSFFFSGSIINRVDLLE